VSDVGFSLLKSLVAVGMECMVVCCGDAKLQWSISKSLPSQLRSREDLQ